MADDPQISLGMLRLLVKVHELGTVSRAARSVHLSQPAASLALRRLRLSLHDPLFVRSGNAMLPTPRCDEVLQTARTVLALVERDILESAAFDPRVNERSFRVAFYDVGELVFLPRLLACLLEQAPLCSIRSKSLHALDLPKALESGQVELAVGFYPNLERAGFHAQRLFDERFLVLTRKGHPAIGRRRLTVKQFLALPHVTIEPLGRSYVLIDRLFEGAGLNRRIVLTTPHFMSVPQILAVTDLVATVPSEMAKHFAKLNQLQAFDPPVNTPPYAVKQYWHERFHNDPGHRWLRRSIFTLFKT